MIEVFLVIRILTCVAGVILACVIVSRDPGLRINRLMAVIPALVACWACFELMRSFQPDVEAAETWARAMAGPWLLLGPACLHIFAELSSSKHSVAGRLLPFSYGASLLAFGVHFATGWGMGELEPVPWGYAFELSPSFSVMYTLLVAPIAYVLIEGGKVLPQSESRAERRGWTILYASVVAVIAVATLTNVLLPSLGVRVPPMGTTLVIIVAYGLSIQFRRYGYALMSPGTFASQILETLNDGVVMLRPNGELRSANAAFEELADTKLASARNRPFANFVPGFDCGAGALATEVECELFARNGVVIPVLISPTPLFNPSGVFTGIALLIRDLREVSALRGSLVASDRLATVGGLSASISEEIREPVSEIRNLLQGIQLRLDCLVEVSRACTSRKKLDELVREREELIDECLEGIDRIDAIVRDVKGFAAEASGPLEPVDLNTLVEDALRIVRARVRRDLRVDTQFDRLTPIPCVAGEIVQVLVNLLANAIHATGEQGHVQIATWQHEREVWICIEDDGHGVPREVLTRIFDPFFTTKAVGDGTGLGLAISHHIVRNHGGDLRVESEHGRGTRFTLVLPVDPEVPCSETAVSTLLSR